MASFFRHTATAILRAALDPPPALPSQWPDLSSVDSCAAWLRDRNAAPSAPSSPCKIGSPIKTEARTAVRELLDEAGRSTLDGTASGTVKATISDERAYVRWGKNHKEKLSPDTQWFAETARLLEEHLEVLPRLRVLTSNLARWQGRTVYVDTGTGTETAIGCTTLTVVMARAAASPVRVHELIDHVLTTLPESNPDDVLLKIRRWIRAGILVSELRSPNAPLASFAEAAKDVRGLVDIASGDHDTHLVRCGAELDAEVHVPKSLGIEAARAATALIRLSRQPAGDPAWRAYHRQAVERYGTNVRVPLLQLIDPAAGIGYPAGYPGSPHTPVMQPASPQAYLLARAWAALADGSTEVELTDRDLSRITADNELVWPSRVQLGLQIQAASTDALERGDYVFTVDPQQIQTAQPLPPAARGPVPVRISFQPFCPRPEGNDVEEVLHLGEYPEDGNTHATNGRVDLDEVHVIVTDDRLLLGHHQRLIEPQAFQPQAVAQDAPPIVRFLAELPKAFAATWMPVDWGVCLPAFPRIRYGRAILSPARWHLTLADLEGRVSADAACITLRAWRRRWKCPQVVQLLANRKRWRIDLEVPAHVELLTAQLKRSKEADLLEAAPDGPSWMPRAHELIVNLPCNKATAYTGPWQDLPEVINVASSRLPADPSASWLCLRLRTHPAQVNEILADQVPILIDEIAPVTGSTSFWFTRVNEGVTLRFRTKYGISAGPVIEAIAEWADELRHLRLAADFRIEPHQPETGRYGGEAAAHGAHLAHVEDSQFVVEFLRDLGDRNTTVIAAAGTIHIARAILGRRAADSWLKDHYPVMHAASPEASAQDVISTIQLLRGDAYPSAWPPAPAAQWRKRADRLRLYRELLPHPAPESPVESVLQDHRNRFIGCDPHAEAVARRLVGTVIYKLGPYTPTSTEAR